jgi:hypothetical protein
VGSKSEGNSGAGEWVWGLRGDLRQKLKRLIQLQYSTQAGLLTDDWLGGAHAVVRKQRPRLRDLGGLVADSHPVGIDASSSHAARRSEDNDETAVNRGDPIA